MRTDNITKDDLKNQVEHLLGSWIEVDFGYLKQLFGFKRVPGVAMAVSKLVGPSKTDAELSTDPDHIIHDNIKEWCKEHQIEFYLSDVTKSYRFRCSAGCDRILSTILSKMEDQNRMFDKQPRMIVLNIKIARSFHDQQIFNNASYSSSVSPDGKFKILGMDVIEAINVEKDFVELIY
jgi:hypothetical protein